MKKLSIRIFASILTFFLWSGIAAQVPPNYFDTIQQWRSDRQARLIKEDGWLSVAGLFWLKEGVNSVGSGKGYDVGLTDSFTQGRFGEIVFLNGKATLKVDPGSPAEKAGVKEGDRVLEYDGERVRSTRQLTRLVQETPADRTVKMTVQRGGDRRTLDITPSAGDRMSWNERRIGPEIDLDIEREVERGLERGLRDLPRRMEPYFNFRFDGVPGLGARGRLGVQVQPLTGQLGEYFGAKDGGVLVAGVTTDSPAAKAGLKAGDVITKVNGDAVNDTGDLMEALADVKDDGAVTLEILRDRKASTVKATLEPRRPARSRQGNRPA